MTWHFEPTLCDCDNTRAGVAVQQVADVPKRDFDDNRRFPNNVELTLLR